MDGFSNFMVDQNDWQNLLNYTGELQNWQKHVVVMLYGGLANDGPNKYITLAGDALIKNITGDIFEAQTYSNSTVFMDWFHNKSKEVWSQGLNDLWDQVPFDGVWLDLNAPTIFCDGGRPKCTNPFETSKPETVEDVKRRVLAENPLGDDPNHDIDISWYTRYGASYQANNTTYFMPFIPQLNNLDVQTIALNATHHYSNGEEDH